MGKNERRVWGSNPHQQSSTGLQVRRLNLLTIDHHLPQVLFSLITAILSDTCQFVPRTVALLIFVPKLSPFSVYKRYGSFCISWLYPHFGALISWAFIGRDCTRLAHPFSHLLVTNQLWVWIQRFPLFP